MTENQKLDEKIEADDIKIKEYERLLDTLAQDEVEVRRRLSELTRKITVLRVNEKVMSRKYTTILEVEQALRKENNSLKNDMVAMETSVTERLGYLQRYKVGLMF